MLMKTIVFTASCALSYASRRVGRAPEGHPNTHLFDKYCEIGKPYYYNGFTPESIKEQLTTPTMLVAKKIKDILKKCKHHGFIKDVLTRNNRDILTNLNRFKRSKNIYEWPKAVNMKNITILLDTLKDGGILYKDVNAEMVEIFKHAHRNLEVLSNTLMQYDVSGTGQEPNRQTKGPYPLLDAILGRSISSAAPASAPKPPPPVSTSTLLKAAPSAEESEQKTDDVEYVFKLGEDIVNVGDMIEFKDTVNSNTFRGVCYLRAEFRGKCRDGLGYQNNGRWVNVLPEGQNKEIHVPVKNCRGIATGPNRNKWLEMTKNN